MFGTRCQHKSATKQCTSHFVFHKSVEIVAVCCLRLNVFIIQRGYLPSACLRSTAGVPRENRTTRVGTRQSHHSLLCTVAPLTPSRLVRPSSLPYDLPIRAADVPSAQWWPFPFTQSQSCCVTDRIGAPKQLGRKKKIPTWESYAMGGMSKNSKKTMNHPII